MSKSIVKVGQTYESLITGLSVVITETTDKEYIENALIKGKIKLVK